MKYKTNLFPIKKIVIACCAIMLSLYHLHAQTPSDDNPDFFIDKKKKKKTG
jgi:hypothetical protein